MSDLDEDLLALAGGDVSEDSDDYEMGGSAASDDDYDMEEGFQGQDGEEDGGQDEEPNPYPLEGKYKDAGDREALLALPEMERESLLFERSQELQRFQERRLLAQRARQLAQQQKRTSSRTSKVKEVSKKAVKSSKLSELKKQRAKKSRRDAGDEEGSGDESEPGYDEDDEDDYDLGYADEDDYADNVEWASASTRQTVGLDEINRIRTGHSICEKFCFYPGFSRAVIGTFGRLAVNSKEYRLVKIVNIIHGKVYRIGGVKTNQYLVASQPGKGKRPFNMNLFSDSPVSQDELAKYQDLLSDYNSSGGAEDMLSFREYEDKLAELNQFLAKKLVGADFQEYIKRRGMFNDVSGLGANIVLKKTELSQKLQVCKERGDAKGVEYYEKKLRALGSSAKDKQNSVEEGEFSKLNERNRKMNINNIRKAEIERKKELVSSSGDAANPFRRLNTRAKMYYQEAKGEENEKAKLEVVSKAQVEVQVEIKSCEFKSVGGLDRFVSSVEYQFDY